MNYKINNADACKFAIELAKANLESSTEFVPPYKVTDFIDYITQFLSLGNREQEN